MLGKLAWHRPNAWSDFWWICSSCFGTGPNSSDTGALRHRRSRRARTESYPLSGCRPRGCRTRRLEVGAFRDLFNFISKINNHFRTYPRLPINVTFQFNLLSEKANWWTFSLSNCRQGKHISFHFYTFSISFLSYLVLKNVFLYFSFHSFILCLLSFFFNFFQFDELISGIVN